MINLPRNNDDLSHTEVTPIIVHHKMSVYDETIFMHSSPRYSDCVVGDTLNTISISLLNHYAFINVYQDTLTKVFIISP